MSIWKRLQVYGIGITIGLIVSVYFFGDRGCKFLPGNRVRNSITSSKFVTSELTQCKLIQQGYTPKSLANFIKKSSVLFSESNTESDPRMYVLEYEGKKLTFAVSTEREEPVYIVDNFKEKAPACDSLSNKYDKYIKLPFKKK